MGAGEDDRPALFHRARSHLADRPDGQRLLLLVDDIDQLDATSLALLLPLTMERRIFLVATIRTGSALPAVIVSLLKDGHLSIETVPVLSVEEVSTLLHRVLDGPVDTDAVTRLAEVSGGNLQVLREIVLRSLEQGTLVLDGGMWRLEGLPHSAGLDELIGAHLAELGRRRSVEALEALAVAGTLGWSTWSSSRAATCCVAGPARPAAASRPTGAVPAWPSPTRSTARSSASR